MIEKLKEDILSNIESFDRFLREHFYFGHVHLNDGNKNINYEKKLEIFDNFISIELHSCAEIEDSIFVSLELESDEVTEKYEWNGYTLYIFQHINEMD